MKRVFVLSGFRPLLVPRQRAPADQAHSRRLQRRERDSIHRSISPRKPATSKSMGLFVDPVYVASGTKVAQAMIAGEFPIALAGGTV